MHKNLAKIWRLNGPSVGEKSKSESRSCRRLVLVFLIVCLMSISPAKFSILLCMQMKKTGSNLTFLLGPFSPTGQCEEDHSLPISTRVPLFIIERTLSSNYCALFSPNFLVIIYFTN